jgi:hypothetical protein
MTAILTKSVSACLALHIALIMWTQTLSQTVA